MDLANNFGEDQATRGLTMASGMEPKMDLSRRFDEKETDRVEAFSDGVIAIAVTLLILEIKVPRVAEISSAGLLAELLGLWPSFLAFVTSFGMILVMWINHHRIFRL